MVTQLFDDITRALHSEFGDDCKYYVEEIEQNSQRPCFSVGALNPIIKSRSLKRYSRTTPIVIHYFTDKDNTSDAKKDCHRVAERLWQLLEYITFKGLLIRGEDMSWDVVEGVLQFFITYRFDVYKVDEISMMEEGIYNEVPIPPMDELRKE